MEHEPLYPRHASGEVPKVEMPCEHLAMHGLCLFTSSIECAGCGALLSCPGCADCLPPRI